MNGQGISLRAEGVSKTFRTGTVSTSVLDAVDFAGH